MQRKGLRLSARVFVCAFLLIGLVASAPAQEKSAAPATDRWEKEIASMTAKDATNPPPKGGIVFVGSSSIRLWDLKKWFPDLPVINRGFGGSQLADSVRYADRIVHLRDGEVQSIEVNVEEPAPVAP